MADSYRLLVIEDDIGMALALYRNLGEIYTINVAKTALSGMRRAQQINFDAILLDLSLPDMSGLQVCQQLRASGVSAPIVIISGTADTLTKVRLLDAGADDYLTKPFNLEELKARLRVVLRQTNAKLMVDDLTLDGHQRRVERGGIHIPLRHKEFAILECLMSHVNSVVTRDALIDYAWDVHRDAYTNTIDVHINRLREKIDRPFDHSLIKTVHGLGYKLDAVNKPVNT